MKKRLICAALIAAMVISTSACGQMSSTEKMDTLFADPTNGSTYKTADGDAGDDGGEAIPEAYTAMDRTAADGEGLTVEPSVNTAPVGDATIDDPTDKDLPEAGQLTAGQWSDNDNWGFFSNLVTSGTISFPSFGIDPTNRTMITVKGKDGSAVANAKVRLLDKDGGQLWSAVSDKNGVAYLFAQGDKEAASVEVESGGKKQNFAVEGSSSGGEQNKNKAKATEMEVTFDGSGKLYKSMDVMFIVDTTGSMSDEMLFLQSEFTAITKEIGAADTRYSVNFYRDEGDDYVTKCSKFTSNVSDVQAMLNKESADGGGDWPEAVAEALTDTMNADDWKDESVKLAFLIYDAPPHDEKEAELLKAVETAAAKGIRLIPVVASDNDRDTELFGRAIAIATGGTYVFLTDDSGIGNSHEEPIIGSYEVRPLYNIIIDVINSYKQ